MPQYDTEQTLNGLRPRAGAVVIRKVSSRYKLEMILATAANYTNDDD